MECPKCKLINPDSAERCDCGYDFATGSMKESYLTAKGRKACRSCGKLVTATAGVCMYCGCQAPTQSKFEQGSTPSDDSKAATNNLQDTLLEDLYETGLGTTRAECPECRLMIMDSASVCIHCGARIVDPSSVTTASTELENGDLPPLDQDAESEDMQSRPGPSRRKDLPAQQLIALLPIRPSLEHLDSWWNVVVTFVAEDARDKVRLELYLLLAFSIDTGISQGLSDDEEAFAALDALYNVLGWKDKELLTTAQERRQRYVEVLKAPHPEFGVSFMIGKTFAELCGGTDIALMTSGNKLFFETVKATKEMIKQISGEYRIVR